jgi:hypothetical protein
MKETKLLGMCEYVDYMNTYFEDTDGKTIMFYHLAKKEFGEERVNNEESLKWSTYHKFTTAYKEFLLSDIELKRFVACENNIPLEKPCKEKGNYRNSAMADYYKPFEIATKGYNEALKDVWFDGFELLDDEEEGYHFKINRKDGVSYIHIAKNNNIAGIVDCMPLDGVIPTNTKAKDLGLII